MARKKLKPCCKTGCRNTTRERFCEAHRNDTWDSWQQDKGNRHERGYGTAWTHLRKLVITRDTALCQECLRNGHITPFKDVDHIIPKSAGGTDEMTNLECLCRRCHLIKTSKE